MAITNFGPGTFVWTDGAPTHNPDDGAKFAIDVNTYVQYEWVSGTTWAESPISVKKISGTSAPTGAPGLHDSQLAINEVPELYYYFSGSWHLVSGGGGGSYTDEMAQDAVGGILTDTAEIDLTYDDATPAITADLKTTGVTPGTYNNITVDSKGRATSGSNVGYITGNQTITLTGDVTGSGTTGILTSIAANAVGTTEIADDAVTQAKIAANAVGSSELQSTGVAAGSYGSATQVGTFTVDSDGRLTAAANVSITGDNWGSQVVQRGTTLSGDGTAGSPLNVATDGITANEIAPGAVGSSELASTGVTPGSYTYASVTVDADGRLTAASDGTTPLTAVATDATLTGDGSGGNPLGISFPVLAPDGIVTAPSYSFTNYPDGGLWTDGSNTYLQGATGQALFLATQGNGTVNITTPDITGSDAGSINILAGDETTNAATGGAITIAAGTSKIGGSVNIASGTSTNDNGGVFNLIAGASDSGQGGSFNAVAGASNSGTGGNFNMQAGSSTDADGGFFVISAGNSINSNGGYFTMSAGDGANAGGAFTMSAGDGENLGGAFTLTSGDAPSGTAGNLTFQSGSGLYGGTFTMQAGSTSEAGESGAGFLMQAGAATGEDAQAGSFQAIGGAATGTGGSGGGASLTGGAGSAIGGGAFVTGGNGTSGNANGGDVRLQGGLNSGTGRRGVVLVNASVFRIASYTTTARDALTGLQAGDMIFNSTTSKFQGYTGSAWVDFH